jgi:hypothetical protein
MYKSTTKKSQFTLENIPMYNLQSYRTLNTFKKDNQKMVEHVVNLIQKNCS